MPTPLRPTPLQLFLVLLASLLLAACQTEPEAPEAVGPGPDPHSFANHDEVRVEHLALDLAVDFRRRQLAGHAILKLHRQPDSRRLVLDTRDLEIRDLNRVHGDGTLEPLSWRLAEQVAGRDYLGRALIVALEAGVDRVRIDYRTSPDAFGLQWLDGAQTRTGEPFLFSQSQPIYARTWVPLQDTPAVRYTFEATLRVPGNLMALMGAAGNPEEIRGDGVYSFNMPQPIPSYLMAIAVGKLEFQSLGPRSGVYAEPDMLQAAAAEFDELEAMIELGESLYGPYRWDRQDLLVLPPSFPFGGMENPRLSFLTPTIIAGDKSLTGLVAHELAHAWSGNLVTNAEWRDLWLNEGFTTYFENRIIEALHGPERAEMEATLDWTGLREAMSTMAPDEQVLTRDLSALDPEQAFNSIPYDKGRLVLDWLEDRFGRERFDRFLNDYFDHFGFQSIGTEDFRVFTERELFDNGEAAAMLREWLYEPGIPEFAVLPDSDAFEIVDDWRRRWLAGEATLAEIPVEGWSVHEWRQFLLGLGGELDQEQMAAMDQAFGLTESRNVEILYLWLVRSIEARYQPGLDRLEDFLLEVGRNKFTRPLYQELAERDWARDWAIEIYQRARPGYHPLTRQAAERALGIEGG
ncbi:MAG: M1 family metallopeptidase, partial [Wenzhouxiangellaceae bacterium]